MPYSKKEDLTEAQNRVHERFTNYLIDVVGLKTPHHQTESLERRVQIFIRERINSAFTCAYDNRDIQFLEGIIEQIKNDSEWSDYNRRHAGTLVSSIKHYIEFLRYQDGHNKGGNNVSIAKIIYPDAYKEGRISYVHAVGYERNKGAREACIRHYGCQCAVCGFNFEKMYGDIGRDFIEVHHIVPIHKRSGEYIVDPIKDLRPLCSNCHSMIHRRNPVFGLDELKELLKDR